MSLYVQEVIEALIEEAERYRCSETTRHKLHALTVFLKAINVCVTYHLNDELSSIIKNDLFYKVIPCGIKQGLSIYNTVITDFAAYCNHIYLCFLRQNKNHRWLQKYSIRLLQ